MTDLLLNSAQKAAGDTITAAEFVARRLDILEQAGEYRDSTGSANAYVLADDAQVASLQEGQVAIFNANFTCTGACTLNYGGFGAASIKKNNDVNPENGDIESGQICVFRFDGTNWQLLSPTAIDIPSANKATLIGGGDADALHSHPIYAMASNLGSGTRDVATGSGTENIAHGLGRTPKMILFFAIDAADYRVWSKGATDDDLNDSCVSADVAGAGRQSANCIAIEDTDGANGVVGQVSAWDATNFTITWTASGSGRVATYTWIALT